MARRGEHPAATTKAVRERMQAQRRRDTSCEMEVRSAAHRLGLRYRLDVRPIPDLRRRADLVFRSVRLAVFIDGCFWHGCQHHGSTPKANAEWWKRKIDANRRRDRDTDARLQREGWHVIRVWEHEDAQSAAERIAKAVKDLSGQP